MPGPNAIASIVGTAFAAPLHPAIMPQAGPSNHIVFQGWVLKKRRKKMQGLSLLCRAYNHAVSAVPGFARRYFTLYHSGVLSYSFEPGQPARDQILLPQAAISTAPGRKDIHIDSPNATFHIKCLSSEDFTRWMSAFRCVGKRVAREMCG